MTAAESTHGYPLLVGTTWIHTCRCHWARPIAEPAEVLRLIQIERKDVTDPKFLDEPPPEAKSGGRRPSPVFDALRDRPGQWAEINRYPVDQRDKALDRSAYIKRRYSDIECLTRTVEGKVVIFARAVTR